MNAVFIKQVRKCIINTRFVNYSHDNLSRKCFLDFVFTQAVQTFNLLK